MSMSDFKRRLSLTQREISRKQFVDADIKNKYDSDLRDIQQRRLKLQPEIASFMLESAQDTKNRFRRIPHDIETTTLEVQPRDVALWIVGARFRDYDNGEVYLGEDSGPRPATTKHDVLTIDNEGKLYMHTTEQKGYRKGINFAAGSQFELDAAETEFRVGVPEEILAPSYLLYAEFDIVHQPLVVQWQQGLVDVLSRKPGDKVGFVAPPPPVAPQS